VIPDNLVTLKAEEGFCWHMARAGNICLAAAVSLITFAGSALGRTLPERPFLPQSIDDMRT